MRIARRRIGHGVLLDVAGLGIKLADVGLEIRGVPDVAVFIGDQPVRPGLRRQLVLLELLRLGIESAEHIGHLPGVPHGAVRREHGIMRPRSRRRHHPLLDGNFGVARNYLCRRLRLFRKILAEVIHHRIELVRRHRSAHVDHHVQSRGPVFFVVTVIRYRAQGVTNGARRLHGGLSVAFR